MMRSRELPSPTEYSIPAARLFQKPYPIHKLFQMLHKICRSDIHVCKCSPFHRIKEWKRFHLNIPESEAIVTKLDDYFLFDCYSFKKLKYHDLLVSFIQEIHDEYYYPSKRHFAEEDITYERFIVILIHILKSLNIEYHRSMVLSSSMPIVYHINISSLYRNLSNSGMNNGTNHTKGGDEDGAGDKDGDET